MTMPSVWWSERHQCLLQLTREHYTVLAVTGGQFFDLPADAARLVPVLEYTSDADLARLPVSKLTLRLIQPDEVVTAPMMTFRIHAKGIKAQRSAVTMALMRAARDGYLERVGVGMYRLVTPGGAA